VETVTPWAEPVLMTAEELSRLAEDEWHYELLDGRLVRMSPTAGGRGRIVMALLRAVDRFVEEHQLGEVFPVKTGSGSRRMAARIQSWCRILRMFVPDGSRLLGSRGILTSHRIWWRRLPHPHRGAWKWEPRPSGG